MSVRRPTAQEALFMRIRARSQRGSLETFSQARLRVIASNPDSSPAADCDIKEVASSEFVFTPGGPDYNLLCDGSPSKWPGYGRRFTPEECQTIRGWEIEPFNLGSVLEFFRIRNLSRCFKSAESRSDGMLCFKMCEPPDDWLGSPMAVGFHHCPLAAAGSILLHGVLAGPNYLTRNHRAYPGVYAFADINRGEFYKQFTAVKFQNPADSFVGSCCFELAAKQQDTVTIAGTNQRTFSNAVATKLWIHLLLPSSISKSVKGHFWNDLDEANYEGFVMPTAAQHLAETAQPDVRPVAAVAAVMSSVPPGAIRYSQRPKIRKIKESLATSSVPPGAIPSTLSTSTSSAPPGAIEDAGPLPSRPVPVLPSSSSNTLERSRTMLLRPRGPAATLRAVKKARSDAERVVLPRRAPLKRRRQQGGIVPGTLLQIPGQCSTRTVAVLHAKGVLMLKFSFGEG